ncbi:MAG: GNAT family N-acetyltransferase [Chloroflexi bacterium]|nr:GNAT family N-acetyltransferase [Chloroflexota bacterium]
MSELTLREMGVGEERLVCGLVARVFRDAVAPLFTDEGVHEFLRYASAAALRQRVAEGTSRVWLALDGREMLGMIEWRAHGHISLLFVDREHQRQGIGRALLRRALADALRADRSLETLTVNASPNAVPAYERLGFTATEPERMANGIRFVPMAKSVAIGIRDLRPEDVERLVEIAVAAWAPIFAYFRETMGEELLRTAFPSWQEDKAGQVRRACQPASGAGVGVAHIGDEVVGFVTFYSNVQKGIGEIGNNAVHPDWQGLGISLRMYEHAFTHLRQQGMRYVKVETGGDPAHAPARRAYEKAGFDIALPTVVYYRAL